MKDRQPTRPGRVAITDELTGETRYATIEMADEPTEDGTPPTKPNLFDDTTMARFPAGVDTVNLALRQTVLLKDKATEAEAAAGTDDTKWMTPKKTKSALDALVYRVGDIALSKRSSLGSDFLLCNGAKVDISEYPALVPFLTYNSVKNLEYQKAVSTYNVSQSGSSAQKVGNYYAVLWYGNINSSNKIMMSYTQNIQNTWNQVQIGDGSDVYSFPPKMFYINGTYIIVMCLNNSATRVYYSSNIDGPYQSSLAWNGTYFIRDAFVFDGHLFLVASTNGNPSINEIFYNTTAGNYTSWSHYTHRLETTVLGAFTNGSEVTMFGTGHVTTSSNPKNSSSWSPVKTISGLSGYTGSNRDTGVYFNGQPCIFSCKSGPTAHLTYRESDGTWSSRDIISNSLSQGLLTDGSSLYFLVSNTNANSLSIASADSITGQVSSWITIKASTSYYYPNRTWNYCDENHMIIPLTVYSPATLQQIKYSNAGYFLPTISVSGANTFIRAKE